MVRILYGLWTKSRVFLGFIFTRARAYKIRYIGGILIISELRGEKVYSGYTKSVLWIHFLIQKVIFLGRKVTIFERIIF